MTDSFGKQIYSDELQHSALVFILVLYAEINEMK